MHAFPTIVERLRSHSYYARRLTAAHPHLVDNLQAHYAEPFSRADMLRFLSEESAREPGELKSALRRLRQRVWLRTATRDLAGIGDLAEVMTTMTQLAEVSVASAQTAAQQDLIGRFGTPIGDESHTAQELIVVAMGKLGGEELNVSSDVDLIFVYPEEGQTNGARQITNQEFFTLLGKQIISALADTSDEGFVFRVDMRLRPYGESGALAISFPALEAYLITQGRPWERYAWIKARPISGTQHEALNAIVKPFVFRRYLDYGAVAQLRELHRQIRTEVMRRDRINDIKLGPGGIREIEFLAQVFQLIRGGRDVRLQDRSTLATLGNLAAMNLVTQENCDELRASYVFLRNLEHRLQYLDDAQTQVLPSGAEDQLRIANSLGEASYAMALARLDQHRSCVTRQFEAIFSKDPSESKPSTGSLWLSPIGKDESVAYLSKAGYKDASHVYERLSAIQRSSRYQQLPESSRVRFDGLVPAVIEMAAGMPNRDETLIRTLDLFEAVSRRETYLALLLENQSALKKVLELASASGWALSYLQQHPILLDELLDHRELDIAPDWPKLKQQLQQQILAHEGDVERQWDLLRHFKQAQMFRLIAQDIARNLALETLSDHLSDLADCLLDIAVSAAWRGVKTKHRDAPLFCVVAYGKLGGKELGYGSDLDIIFLYDDTHTDAAEQYGRLAQRLNSWLTTYTSAGMLYDTDLRLRPDGASGLLVSSVAAFAEYQAGHAWLWEHQALTRARFCAGDAQVGAAFEKIRSEVLRKERPLGEIQRDVRDMREKMRQGHPNPSALFDIKHDAGGLVDIEFIVQYLVLGFAHRHESLVANVGNIALLEMSGTLGLIEAERAHRVAASYRELRRLQHRAWLDGQTQARVEQQIVAPYAEPVIGLWENLIASSA